MKKVTGEKAKEIAKKRKANPHYKAMRMERRKAAFLKAFPEIGTLTGTAKAVGFAMRSHYKWMESDPDYAEAFQEAKIAAAERLELEATRRAVDGVDEPVWYKGENVGHQKKYSDTLLIFLLKGAMPEKYKERFEHSTTEDGMHVKVDLNLLSDKELKELEEVLEKIEVRGDATSS